MGVSEQLCQQHEDKILGYETEMNIWTGTTTTVFSGAATVVGGEAAKSILAAIAGISDSERALLNETIYRTTISTAVVSKIQSSRKELKIAIDQKLIQNNYRDYPFNSALSDVLYFHSRCSFTKGLIKALEEGTTSSSEMAIARIDQRLLILAGQIAGLPKDSSGVSIKSEMKSALESEYKTLSEKRAALSAEVKK